MKRAIISRPDHRRRWRRRLGVLRQAQRAADIGLHGADYARRHRRHRRIDRNAPTGHQRDGRQPGVRKHRVARRRFQLAREKGSGDREAGSDAVRVAGRSSQGTGGAGAGQPGKREGAARQGYGERRLSEAHVRAVGGPGETEAHLAGPARLCQGGGRSGRGGSGIGQGLHPAGDGLGRTGQGAAEHRADQPRALDHHVADRPASSRSEAWTSGRRCRPA